MAAYSLSAKPAADLDGIYEYTILQFGLEQARAYLKTDGVRIVRVLHESMDVKRHLGR